MNTNNSKELIKTYAQICRKTWVDQCAVKLGTFMEWEIYGFLFFHSTVIVKDIYTSKYGNNLRPNKHAFNHKLFHIYNYVEITKYYKLVGPYLSAHQLILLQCFSSSTESLTQKLELQILFLTLSSFSVYCL